MSVRTHVCVCVCVWCGVCVVWGMNQLMLSEGVFTTPHLYLMLYGPHTDTLVLVVVVCVCACVRACVRVCVCVCERERE